MAFPDTTSVVVPARELTPKNSSTLVTHRSCLEASPSCKMNVELIFWSFVKTTRFLAAENWLSCDDQRSHGTRFGDHVQHRRHCFHHLQSNLTGRMWHPAEMFLADHFESC